MFKEEERSLKPFSIVGYLSCPCHPRIVVHNFYFTISSNDVLDDLVSVFIHRW